MLHPNLSRRDYALLDTKLGAAFIALLMSVLAIILLRHGRLALTSLVFHHSITW